MKLAAGAGTLAIGVALLILGLYLRFAQGNTDGGTVWPILGLIAIAWGALRLSTRGHLRLAWFRPRGYAAAIKEAGAAGVGPVPWPLSSADRASAFRLTTLLSGSEPALLVEEGRGVFGPSLEVIRSGSSRAEPLVILMRTWSSEEAAVKTLLMYRGAPDRTVQQALTEEGFTAAGASAPWASFLR